MPEVAAPAAAQFLCQPAALLLPPLLCGCWGDLLLHGWLVGSCNQLEQLPHQHMGDALLLQLLQSCLVPHI